MAQYEAQQPGPFFENLITVKQLSEQIHLSVAYIYRLMKEEGLPYFKLGRATRFRVKEISAWLDQRKRP